MSNDNESEDKKRVLIQWYDDEIKKEQHLKEKRKAEKLFDEIITHSRIKKSSEDHFRNEKYRSAVLDAMIELEEMIKEKAKFPKNNQDKELSGYKLMFKVFDSNNPILRWSSLKRQTQIDELDGYKYIMAGAVLGIRNPKAHLRFEQKPLRAIQLLHLATLLAELVDDSEYVEQNS